MVSDHVIIIISTHHNNKHNNIHNIIMDYMPTVYVMVTVCSLSSGEFMQGRTTCVRVARNIGGCVFNKIDW